MVFAYFSALENELIFYKENYEIEINTVYIGGGTPSFVPARYILKLLEFIYSNFKVKNTCEISIEANPESITKEKLKSYRKAGINRLSVGIQALNDTELKSIGRVHDSAVALKILSVYLCILRILALMLLRVFHIRLLKVLCKHSIHFWNFLRLICPFIL